jgi:AraC-like DNA-binding protein
MSIPRVKLHMHARLGLFGPPYSKVEPISTDWKAAFLPPAGLAIVWSLIDGMDQRNEFEWLLHRPHGVPLIVILPPVDGLGRAMPLLSYVNALQPKAVLPDSSLVSPLVLRKLLAGRPRDFGRDVTRYLIDRGLLNDLRVRKEVEQLFSLAPTVSSTSKIAQHLYTSRRTLGRHFASAGLPVPSHWLQFARLLLASTILQSEHITVFRVAVRVGYPDGFTMSNQMKRLLGYRPSDVRSLLGWEWLVEAWLKREALEGGIDIDMHATVVGMYIERRQQLADGS